MVGNNLVNTIMAHGGCYMKIRFRLYTPLIQFRISQLFTVSAVTSGCISDCHLTPLELIYSWTFGRFCVLRPSYCFSAPPAVSPVGIATLYGLDGPGIESCTRPYRPWVPPSFLYNGYRVISGGKTAGAWRRPPIPIAIYCLG